MQVKVLCCLRRIDISILVRLHSSNGWHFYQPLFGFGLCYRLSCDVLDRTWHYVLRIGCPANPMLRTQTFYMLETRTGSHLRLHQSEGRRSYGLNSPSASFRTGPANPVPIVWGPTHSCPLYSRDLRVMKSQLQHFKVWDGHFQSVYRSTQDLPFVSE